MKKVGRIVLSLLILFGALNPVVYADCCDSESESACCTLKSRHGHESGEEESHKQAKACHIQKAFPDGLAHFSCCAHLPIDFIESYTVRPQEKVQELLSGFGVLAYVSHKFECTNNSTNIFFKKPRFGNMQEPPCWLSFRNIRC